MNFFVKMINLKLNPRQKKIDKGSLILNPIEIPLKDRCRKIVAGPMHSYALSEKKVYLWGKKPIFSTDDSNRSKSNDANEQNKMVQLAIEVDNIATGPNHTFAWNSKDVYCWGSNENYELGLEQQKEYGCHKVQLFEEAMKNGYQLKQIQCGQSHTLAIFHVKEFQREEELFPSNKSQITQREQENEEESIQMFAWGKSQSFQLTINSVHIIPYPVLTPCSFKHLTEIKSKSDFNVALCNQKVYTWGANLFYRLGSGQSKVRIPQQVSLPAKISKIGIGNHHVFAVTSSGQAYSWGKGDLGQLGIDRFQADSKPNKVICEQYIIDAACGDFHTLVLLKNTKLKSCGGNKNGVLGHSNYDLSDKKKRCKRLQFVDNVELFGQIKMIACGNHHNLVLNNQGRVFGWGNNDYYQVLPGQKSSQSKQEQIKPSKRPLEIIIDEENSINRSEEENIQNRSISFHLQKLENWKRRYNHFREQKAKEQEMLLKEYDQILSNIKKMNK